MKKRIYAFALLVAMLLGSFALPTAAETLTGDVLDDKMGYEDINAVPWGNGWTSSRVSQPEGFTGDWKDATEPKVGGVEMNDGKIRMFRTGTLTGTNTVTVSRVLSTGAQPVNDMTLEYEYVKDTKAKVYVNIASPTSWKGPLAITHVENGTFAAAGTGASLSGANAITATGKVKVTMHLHKAEGNADIYINDQLLKKGYRYDTRYGDYYDVGKVNFVLQEGTELNQGITINYVRYMETAEYVNIALAKDAKATIDTEPLPEDGATLENDLTLPELNTLPYGSIPYLESSDDSILNAETGAVTRRLEEQNVTLTLKMKKLNENGEYVSSDVIEQWNYTVAKSTATLQDDVNALSANDLLGQNAAADQITTALTLPSAGKYAGSDITWSMTPEDAPVDLATGAVTRPVYGDDVPVKLTAAFTSGEETLTKDFNIVILTQPSFVTNLAKNKSAVASAVYSTSMYPAAEATDGNLATTRWASKGNNNWIYVDLGAAAKVSALRFYEWNYRITGFVVEYSDDAQNWTAAKTVTGLPGSGTATHRPGYTTEFPATTARYWRLRQTAGSADISIFELELYDTTQRFYESAVLVNDETLGSVQRSGGPGYTPGAEVALSAQPAQTGKFVRWQLPEGLSLTEGSAQSPDIKYAQPQKNIKLVAEFEEKTAASIDVETAVYDKHEGAENHKNIVVTFTPGDYILQSIRCGKDTLEEGTQYTKEENVITLLQSWLETLDGEQTIIFQTDGGMQPSLKLEISDSDPAVLIQADLAAITKPDYQIKNGTIIPAVGPQHGSDIIVTSSNTNVLQVVRETQNGQLVNKLVVTATVNSNVTLTISGALSGVTASLPEQRHAVAGKGSGSGGSGGGGGGGSTSRPSSGSGVINYGNGTATVPPQQGGTETVQPGRFGDMPKDYWAHDYVELLVEKGIVSGDDKGNFSPEQQVTREEFVKMIVLTLGLETDSTAALPFEDIAEGDWSYPYIAAAYEAGIISGTEETLFGAGTTMSRQDIAVVTARALDAAQVTILPVTESVHFADETDTADYAAAAVSRIARCGIVGGYPDGSFQPLGTITRAEAAKVLAQVIRLKEE